MEGIDPVVSVVVPVYNIEAFLPGCLQSLLDQTCAEIEILCIDDASEDGSARIVQEFQAQDPRVQLLRQSHQGVSAARNLGIRNARGKYIAFFDGDDYVNVDMLQNMVSAAEAAGCDMVICSAKVEFQHQSVHTVRQDRSITGSLTVTADRWHSSGSPEDIWQVLSRPGCWPFIWNKLIRTELLRKNRIFFPPGLPLGEDGVFNQLLFQYAGSAAFLPDALYHYRYRHPASATVRLSQNRESRFFQHTAVVTEVLRSFSERNLLEKNGPYLVRWALQFLYSDFVALPPGPYAEASIQLQALFQQYKQLNEVKSLHPIERRRFKIISMPVSSRTRITRFLDIFLTKAENRMMRLFSR